MKIWDRQKERNKDTQKDEARYRVAPQLKISFGSFNIRKR